MELKVRKKGIQKSMQKWMPKKERKVCQKATNIMPKWTPKSMFLIKLDEKIDAKIDAEKVMTNHEIR